ncbi:MAG: hypothetical protein M5U26_27525 [Planctomycetota bacterium]|nr:hypothetical protein [Planctomycetota bacterium]
MKSSVADLEKAEGVAGGPSPSGTNSASGCSTIRSRRLPPCRFEIVTVVKPLRSSTVPVCCQYQVLNSLDARTTGAGAPVPTCWL